MPQLTESAIEELAIERLEQLGYKYLHGSVVAFDGSSPERTSYTDVILDGRLRAAVVRLRPRREQSSMLTHLLVCCSRISAESAYA